MSVTVSGSPQNQGRLSPAYNPIVYYVDSPNTSEPNYRYIAEFYNTDSAELIFTKKVPPRPIDSFGVIDCNRQLSDYVTYASPSSTGVTNAPATYLRYNIKLREEYTRSYLWTSYSESTGLPAGFNGMVELTFQEDIPYVANDQIIINQSDGGLEQPLLEGILTVVSTGSSSSVVVNRTYESVAGNVPGTGSTVSGTTYYADGTKFTSSSEDATLVTGTSVFNGAIPHNNFMDYDWDTYQIPLTGSVGATDGNWLSTLPLTGATMNRHQHLLLNAFTNFRTTSVLRYVYLENDLGTIKRRLKLFSSNYITPINAGPGNATEGQYTTVAGSGSIFDAAAKWYTVHLGDTSGTLIKTQKFKIMLDNRCYKHEPVNLMFLDSLGSFSSFAFNYKSEQTQNIKRTTARYALGELNSETNEYSYTPEQFGEGTLDVSKVERLSITTAWLSDVESAHFQELISSPYVLWQDPNQTGRNYPVIVETTSSILQKKINNKNIRYTIVIRFANQNAINW